MSSQWQHRGIVVHDGGLTTVRAITAIRTDALRRGATVTVTALHGPGGCRAATAQTADRTVVVGDLHDPDELLQAIASTDATHWWPTMPELAAEPELTARVAAAGVRVIGPAASTLSRWRQPDLARLVAEVADQHPVRLGSGPLPPTARLVEVVVHGRQARVQLLAALDRSLRLGERTLLTRQLPPATLPCGIEGAALALAMASRLDGVATVTFAIEDTAAAAVLFGIRPGADAAAAGTDVDALQLAAACEDAADGTGVDTVADPDLGATSSIAEADAHPSDTPDATTTTWTAEVHALPATPGGVPGRVELLQVPSAPGLTVEPAVRLGEHLPHATPVAAVTVHGPDAVEARLKLQLALTELRVVLNDGATDEGRLLSLLQRPELQHDPTGDTGPLRVGWVAALEAEGALEDARHADLAVLLAAVEAAGAREREERRRLFSSARRGRLHLGPRDARPIELQLGGHVYLHFVQLLTLHERLRPRAAGPGSSPETERLRRLRSRRSADISGACSRRRRQVPGTISWPSCAVVEAPLPPAGRSRLPRQPLGVRVVQRSRWRIWSRTAAAPASGV